MNLFALAGAALAASRDFPADTLLPSRRVETSASSQSPPEEIRFDYARDARDWLHETRTWSQSGLSVTRVEVTITDQNGLYRGGSLQRGGNPPIIYDPVYGREGRMDRRNVSMGGVAAVEYYRYDSHGNAVEKLTLSGGDTTDWEFYPHTYDSLGRIASRKDFDRDSLNSTQVFRYDSLGRRAVMVEYLNPWELIDSTVYEYRPDGRVDRELHFHQFGGPPAAVVTWEYRIWQVPLSRVWPSRPRSLKSGKPSEGRVFDPLGRGLPSRFPILLPRLRRP